MNYIHLKYTSVFCHLYDVKHHLIKYVNNILLLHNTGIDTVYEVNATFNMFNNPSSLDKICYPVLDNQQINQQIDTTISEIIEKRNKVICKDILNNTYVNLTRTTFNEDTDSVLLTEINKELIYIFRYRIYMTLYAINNICVMNVEIPVYSYIKRSVFNKNDTLALYEDTISEPPKSPYTNVFTSPKMLSLLSHFKQQEHKDLQVKLKMFENIVNLTETYEDNIHRSPNMTSYKNIFIEDDNKSINFHEHLIEYMNNMNMFVKNITKLTDMNVVFKKSEKYSGKLSCSLPDNNIVYDFDITSDETVRKTSSLDKIMSIIPPLSL